MVADPINVSLETSIDICHVPIAKSDIGMSNPWQVDILACACVEAVFVIIGWFCFVSINVHVPLFSMASIAVRIWSVEVFWFAAVIWTLTFFLLLPSIGVGAAGVSLDPDLVCEPAFC
jgi:hypothetical protein